MSTTDYMLGLSKAGVNTANTVMWQVRAPTRLTRIKTVGIFVEVAPTTAPQFVLARATAGGTSTTSTVGQLGNPIGIAATTTVDSAWSSAPTFTTSGPFLAKATLPVTAGSGVYFDIGEGIWCRNGTATDNLVIANAVATGATVGSFGLHVIWDE